MAPRTELSNCQRSESSTIRYVARIFPRSLNRWAWNLNVCEWAIAGRLRAAFFIPMVVSDLQHARQRVVNGTLLGLRDSYR